MCWAAKHSFTVDPTTVFSIATQRRFKDIRTEENARKTEEKYRNNYMT